MFPVQQNLSSVAFLTANYHVCPDFHGNRSPLADSAMTGALCELTLDRDVEQLAKAYLATIQASNKSTISCIFGTIRVRLLLQFFVT